MKKKEELKWRLGKLPTPSEVSELVKDKIITHEEARDILFSKETKEDRNVEELKSEIKFLKDVIEKLSTSDKIVQIIETVKPIYIRQKWYKPYVTWADNWTYYSSGISIGESGRGTINYSNGSDNSMSLCSFSSIN